MKKRLTTGVAAIALVVGSFTAFGAFSAAASGAATISITPNTGLTNGAAVQVTGSGFTPNQGLGSMAAVECIATATTEAGCDVADYVLVTSDANGNVSFTFNVKTGTIGNGTCGTSAADATCLITVGTVSGGKTLAYAPITFASGGATTTTTTTTPSGTASTSTTPTVQVTPSTGLTNGASVSVTGTGFTPSDSVYAVECLATATSAAGCDAATATPITVGTNGALPATTFKVVTGTVGTGTCGTTTSNLSNCIIEVANPSGADAGGAPITFKAATVVPAPPKAVRSIGVARPGSIAVIVVVGSHFSAVAKIVGPAGAAIHVARVVASRLVLRVREVARARKGAFFLTIHFKNGTTARVKYVVK